MVMTSPPYFGLRTFAVERDVITGGDSDCRHSWKTSLIKGQVGGGNQGNRNEHPNYAVFKPQQDATIGACTKCGAFKGQYGHEKNVTEYVEHTTQVLREIRRVLRNDGICFWNIADSYGQDKNLILVPERVAIAAQDDGWIVRSMIIWHKTNCVPESVQDRPTACYEYVLMLVKQKTYFWNSAEAVEPSASAGNGNGELKLSPPIGNAKHQALKIGTLEGNRTPMLDTRHIRNVWSIPTTTHSESHVAIFPEALAERAILCGSREGDTVFDPFAGSGTTGLVAKSLNRNFVMMDISAEYCELMQSRTEIKPRRYASAAAD